MFSELNNFAENSEIKIYGLGILNTRLDVSRILNIVKVILLSSSLFQFFHNLWSD
jgi:hypothetical protein